MCDELRTELAAYEERRGQLLAVHHGAFVLIQGDTLHGVFPTEEEALTAGFRQFRLRPPFLVRRIEREEEEPVHFLPHIVSSGP